MKTVIHQSSALTGAPKN